MVRVSRSSVGRSTFREMPDSEPTLQTCTFGTTTSWNPASVYRNLLNGSRMHGRSVLHVSQSCHHFRKSPSTLWCTERTKPALLRRWAVNSCKCSAFPRTNLCTPIHGSIPGTRSTGLVLPHRRCNSQSSPAYQANYDEDSETQWQDRRAIAVVHLQTWVDLHAFCRSSTSHHAAGTSVNTVES